MTAKKGMTFLLWDGIINQYVLEHALKVEDITNRNNRTFIGVYAIEKEAQAAMTTLTILEQKGKIGCIFKGGRSWLEILEDMVKHCDQEIKLGTHASDFRIRKATLTQLKKLAQPALT